MNPMLKLAGAAGLLSIFLLAFVSGYFGDMADAWNRTEAKRQDQKIADEKVRVLKPDEVDALKAEVAQFGGPLSRGSLQVALDDARVEGWEASAIRDTLRQEKAGPR